MGVWGFSRRPEHTVLFFFPPNVLSSILNQFDQKIEKKGLHSQPFPPSQEKNASQFPEAADGAHVVATAPHLVPSGDSSSSSLSDVRSGLFGSICILRQCQRLHIGMGRNVDGRSALCPYGAATKVVIVGNVVG